MKWIINLISSFFSSLINFFKILYYLFKSLEFKAMLLLSIFFIGVLGLILSFIYLVVKKNTIRKYGPRTDSWIKEKLKIFLGMSKEKDSVEEYFNNADRILKSFLKNSKYYKYELPWYLTFGLSKAGKSTFFNCVELERPLEMENNNDSYLNHYFFNDGIIIDVKSDLIFNDSLHDFSWERLLNNLKNTREKKSVDGIIYFVSLKDLLSDGIDESSKIKKDIEFLYTKLWQMQNVFAMKIPVYVIFTHLDYINGFDKFIDKVEKSYDDIFGWSNPHSLESRFNEEWIDEMFFSIDESLKYIQSEMMVSFPSEVSFDMMNFLNNFREAQSKISELLISTFQHNKYASGLYFRGAYFTSAQNIKNNKIESTQFSVEDEMEYTNYVNIPGKLYFGKDLLTKKIFMEKNIGKNEFDRKVMNYYIKRYKIFIGSFSVFSFLYIYKLNKDLNYIQDSLSPKIFKLIEVLKICESDSNHIEKKDFLNELKIVLVYLDDISKYDLLFYGVPTSLFSSLNRNKNKLFFKAYNELVLNFIFKDIEKRYFNLSNYRFLISAFDNRDLRDPVLMQEFLNLEEVVNEAYLLETYENKFDSIVRYSSIDNLKILFKELFDIEIVDKFGGNIIYTNVWKNDEILMKKIYSHKENIFKKFNWCISNFDSICFSTDRVDIYFKNLNELLLLVDNESDNMTYNNMQNIQNSISTLITFCNSSQFDWLKNKHFSSLEFNKILEKISKSQILGGVDNAEKIYKTILKSYDKFKKTADNYRLPMIGRPFYLYNKQLRLNYSILNIHGLLNNIFSETFMGYSEDIVLERLDINEHIKWDEELLSEVNNMIKNYINFSKRRPNNKFEKVVKNVADKNIKKMIYFKLSKARKIISLRNDKSLLISLAENIKNTYQNMYDILRFLKMTDNNAFLRLKTIEKFNLKFYLKAVNEAFESDRLYQIKDESLGADPENKKLYFKINLQDYLESQRDQLCFYLDKLVRDAIKAFNGIRFISEEKMIFNIAYKFESLLKDLEIYKLNPSNSKLFQLESFFNKIENESISLIVEYLRKNSKKEISNYRFLDSKIVILKGIVNRFLYDSIESFIHLQYESAYSFYEEYALAFPFNLNGELIGIKGYEEMVRLTNDQKSILNFIKIIDPNYKARTFEFVDSLSKCHQLVKYIRNNEEYMVLKFKPYQKIAEIWEKNLRYLLNFSAKVNGQKTINLYWVGDLKVYDSIDFEIELAKGHGMQFVNIDKVGYKLINKTILNIKFTRQEFVRFILENVKIINNQSFIRFTIDIEDDKGIKDELTIMLPIELTLNGLTFTVPQKAFDQLIGDKV